VLTRRHHRRRRRIPISSSSSSASTFLYRLRKPVHGTATMPMMNQPLRRHRLALFHNIIDYRRYHHRLSDHHFFFLHLRHQYADHRQNWAVCGGRDKKRRTLPPAIIMQAAYQRYIRPITVVFVTHHHAYCHHHHYDTVSIDRPPCHY
jgi:hypothetical protein